MKEVGIARTRDNINIIPAGRNLVKGEYVMATEPAAIDHNHSTVLEGKRNKKVVVS